MAKIFASTDHPPFCRGHPEICMASWCTVPACLQPTCFWLSFTCPCRSHPVRPTIPHNTPELVYNTRYYRKSFILWAWLWTRMDECWLHRNGLLWACLCTLNRSSSAADMLKMWEHGHSPAVEVMGILWQLLVSSRGERQIMLVSPYTCAVCLQLLLHSC